MEYPAESKKPVSKLLAAGWIATFVLDLTVYVACVVLAAKGIGWLLPLFAFAGIKSTLALDKKRIRNAFALRHQVKAESFAAEVRYLKANGYIGSDAGAAYMHNRMLCFEGLYSRFRLDPKWVHEAGRVVTDSSASFTLVNDERTNYVHISIDSINEDGKGSKISSDELGRYVKPWLDEEVSDVAQPLFPPTKQIASRWYDARTIAEGIVCLISMLATSTFLLLNPRFGLFDKILCGMVFAVSLVINGLFGYVAIRAGLHIRKMLRRFPDRSDASAIIEILKEEAEFVKTQAQA